MNYLLALLLAGIVPATEREQLELKLVFDRNYVALGDVAYCDVQLWNKTGKVIEFPRPIRSINLTLTIELGDKSFRPGLGACGGANAEPIPPGRCISNAQIVQLFEHELLDELDKDMTIRVRGSYRSNGVTVESEPVEIRIVGRISSRPELVSELYPPFVPGDSDLTKVLRQPQPTMLLMQEQLLRKVLDKLGEDLRPDTAFYREVVATQIVDDYARLGKTSYEEMEKQLVELLSRCAPAERKYLHLYSGYGLEARWKTTEGRYLQEIDLEERLREFAN